MAMEKENAMVTTEKALFAGGCFWCMEKPFEKLAGVLSVESGYSGGSTANPTYKNYMRNGHIEVVQVKYNPEVVGYNQLLDTYWRQVDPTDDGGQFVDRGHGYTTAIYYYDQQQQLLECDHRVKEHTDDPWQVLFLKEKRDDGDALDEVDGQEHQEAVYADQSNTRIRQEHDQPAADYSPDHRFR